MKYDLFSLYLLSLLEQFIPYMEDEDLFDFLCDGRMPASFLSFFAKKAEHEKEVKSRIKTALERQKSI